MQHRHRFLFLSRHVFLYTPMMFLKETKNICIYLYICVCVCAGSFGRLSRRVGRVRGDRTVGLTRRGWLIELRRQRVWLLLLFQYWT